MKSTPMPTAVISARSRATSARSSRSIRSNCRQATGSRSIGQIDSMNAAFRDLAIGILFAAVFVYLLMVVNYQNLGDPLVVILALPATFCGIVDNAVHHRHDAQRTVADGGDHGDRRGIGKFDPARHLCARAAAGRHECVRCGDLGRPHANSPGADDGGGDDRRHDSDGDRRRPARNRTRRWRAP